MYVVKKTDLIGTYAKPSQFPDTEVPEIAFAGKSNVGKSSMINALLNRKKLARTSSSPGKTQTINFYNVNDELRFVDLPGYGYAKVSKTLRESWGKMIEGYLTNRPNLKQVFLLVDIRHTPGENDQMMCDWIRQFGFDVFVIATKADKLSNNQRIKALSEIQTTLKIREANRLIAFSSETKLNKDLLWDLMVQVALGENSTQE